jgi:DNA-binding response OmpR family regulator
LSIAIQQAGYQVTIAVSRAEALEKAFLQDYDLYLINGVRADEQALKICCEIHKADAERRNVMYGMGVSPEEQERGLGSGARSYLTKAEDLLSIGKFVTDLLAA